MALKLGVTQLLPALIAVVLMGRANGTRAASFTVDSTADAVDASPGDGVCAASAGQCTLRAAIQETNARRGADSISVPAGTYVLAIPGAGEDASATGDLDITDDLTITGSGAGRTIVDGGHLDRVFHVIGLPGGPTVQISGLTVRNGFGDRGGGGIFNSGTLALSASAVVDNSAVGAGGGGVANDTGAVLSLTDSTVTGNTANNGGGLGNLGTMTITRTTLSANSAQVEGGGLGGAGTNIVIGSLISGNHAGGQGGGIAVPPAPGAALTVDGSTISGNTAMLNGGGITVGGTFAISGSVVSGNVSQANGGGIFFRGGTITGSAVINNSAAAEGGGICDVGTATIGGATISGNFAGGMGGGAVAMANGTLDIANSTISGNATTTDGGGIASDAATIRLNNVTVADNRADSDGDGIGDGGGLATAGTLVSISNTIIADNVDTGGEAPDCIGQINSQGYNLIEDATNCVLVGGPADITGQDPKLGPLANNGGATETQALLRGSPAIDTGNPAAPGSGGNACEATDQRGVDRPQDGDADGLARCDIGAFERTTPRPPR